MRFPIRDHKALLSRRRVILTEQAPRQPQICPYCGRPMEADSRNGFVCHGGGCVAYLKYRSAVQS